MQGVFSSVPLSDTSRCPMVQLSSDATSLELASHPISKGLSPIGLPPLGCQWEAHIVRLTDWMNIQGLPTAPFAGLIMR